jgi:phospholipid/cholesterol/gamma-HCH transport system ATP-binding protein
LDTSPHHIEFKNVSYEIHGKVVFKNISLQIPRGKISVLLGPSGIGKTTVLRLISGHIHPNAGKVFVDGECVGNMNKKQLYVMRRKMGMLFQTGALFGHLSVYENIAFPLREHLNLPEDLIHNLVLLKLEAVGLRGAAQLMPEELSGGMSRRVALARSIIMDPKLMMYDEPLTGQDPINIAVLLKLIKMLNRTLHMTSILISHQIHSVTKIADYFLLFQSGGIIAAGSPRQVLNSKDPLVSQFMKGNADGVIPFHYPACDLEEDFLK